MSRCAVLAVLVAACGDAPSLRVEVEHPSGITIAETVVSVYESELLSCSGVEFGDFSASELAAALVAEDHVDAVTGESDGLAGISRAETKVIVARGFDSAGAFVTAGCVEKGVVDGAETVTIVTVPTATVSVAPAGQDVADPFGMLVTVTDPLVRSLEQRTVAWRVFGAAGATPYSASNMTIGTSDWTPASPPCTNANGVLKIHPMPPAQIGGFATQVRVSWSSEPPRVFTSFTKLDTTPKTFTPVAGAQRWCAPRAAGATQRLVCIDEPGATAFARDYAVSIVDGGARLAEMATHSFADDNLLLNEKPVAVYSVDRGGGTRDVYAVTNRARVVGLFDPSVAATGNPRAIDVDDAIIAPGCGALPPQLMLHVRLTAEIRAMDAAGASAPAPFFDFATTEVATFNQSGCVTELDPGGVAKLRQVVALDIGRQTSAVFACDAAGGMCQVRMPVPRAGVGFLPGAEPRLLGAFLDASGVVLSSFVLQADQQRNSRLVERDRTPAAAFPQRIVVGKLDDDAEPDLFWNIQNVANNATSFQISYGREVAGERLAALSAGVDGVVVIDELVADLTGDGHDDVIVTVQDSPTLPTTHGVVVIPAATPSPSFAPMLDTPCQ